MQMMRARRLELNGHENGNGPARGVSTVPVGQEAGRAPQTPQSSTPPTWSSEEGCSLLLTDQERAFLEARFAELTRREREVIFALCTGGTNEGMAERLCIALPTLRTHLMRLNQKLGTSSKGDVVRLVAMHLLGAYRLRRIAPMEAPDGLERAGVGT